MNISQFIKHLEELREEWGEYEVVVEKDNIQHEAYCIVDEDNQSLIVSDC